MEGRLHPQLAELRHFRHAILQQEIICILTGLGMILLLSSTLANSMYPHIEMPIPTASSYSYLTMLSLEELMNIEIDSESPYQLSHSTSSSPNIMNTKNTKITNKNGAPPHTAQYQTTYKLPVSPGAIKAIAKHSR